MYIYILLLFYYNLFILFSNFLIWILALAFNENFLCIKMNDEFL